MTLDENKKINAIIGDHLPVGYRERLLAAIQEIKIAAYEKGNIKGMENGTKYPWTS